jgi:hypothetical protein
MSFHVELEPAAGGATSLSALLLERPAIRCVALSFVDPNISQCLAVAQAVDTLSAALADAPAQLLQIVVGLAGADKRAREPFYHACRNSFFAAGPEAEHRRLLAWCGLGRVAALPEVFLLDVSAGGAISPRYSEAGADLKRNLQAPSLSADRFPHSWPRNCAVVRVAQLELGLSRPALSGGSGVPAALPFFAAHMTPEQLLQYAFYSGDVVLLKPIGDVAASGACDSAAAAAAAAAGAATATAKHYAAASGACDGVGDAAGEVRLQRRVVSACAYINPPPEAEEGEGEQVADDGDGKGAAGPLTAAPEATASTSGAAGPLTTGAGPASTSGAAGPLTTGAGPDTATAEGRPVLHLPGTLAADLGLRTGDAVCMLPYDDVGEAERVEFVVEQEPGAGTLEAEADTGLAATPPGGRRPARSAEHYMQLLAALHATFGVVPPHGLLDRGGHAVAAAVAAAGLVSPASRVANAVAEFVDGGGEGAVGAAAGAGSASDGDASEAGVGAASAPVQLSAAQRAYLEELVKSGQCRYAPLVAGQSVLVPILPRAPAVPTVAGAAAASGGSREAASAAGPGFSGAALLRVAATVPRHRAVLVGPDTVLHLRATGAPGKR